jgi:hypothetical protein
MQPPPRRWRFGARLMLAAGQHDKTLAAAWAGK